MVDESNNFVVWYLYDSWGKPLGIGGSLANTLGVLQPFRYRGYAWDAETAHYYLLNRYYSPSILRFISVDNHAQDNAYQYCENQPVIYSDADGTEKELSWETLKPFGRDDWGTQTNLAS